MDKPFRIRPARRSDCRRLAELERGIFTDPWPASAFADLIGPLSLVAEANGEVVGYVMGRLAGGEGEVLNVAVGAEHRRRGLGRRLLIAFLEELADNEAESVFLEVRESNRGARALYEALGFQEVGRRPGYYRLPHEDAVVLKRNLGAASWPAF